MLIRIGKFDITECWDGVFYKKLSRYPEITAWEIQTVLDFIRYEKDNGRTCTIEADRKIINASKRTGRSSTRLTVTGRPMIRAYVFPRRRRSKNARRVQSTGGV